MKRLVTIGILVALTLYAFRQHRDHPSPPEPASATEPGQPAAQSTADLLPESPAAFRCDGRTRCSQMTSCEEATYFLRHCPGVEMDGDRDGEPCERQWCDPP